MSVLGLDSGYTGKYNPLPSPSGTPSGKGLCMTVYPSSRPNTDTVYTVEESNASTGQCIVEESVDSTVKYTVEESVPSQVYLGKWRNVSVH